ncbi:hypothetical protein CQW23_06538 [Capsicum baccatum]|uniref:Bulb-type lectin domain-containing protein n=1 Tax=Capsicum baccatum TaxID=33114 RepID=A0A2G2X3K5_CAPBA|nr:hypothetical protein CQW23_06538 [Capsicum baccatum]
MAFHCMFLLAVFLVFPLSTIAQSYKNVSLGSTLTTSDVTKFWPSPSGDFAFGFQRIRNGSSGFLLAIWFNKLEGKTIVWSANRNNIAPEGSKVELSIDGRLVLTDPNGQEIGARDTASAGPVYGAMLDTGNFVLATSSLGILWKSFDEPTDTILPGQVLNQRSRLVSSFSSTNASSGRFEVNFNQSCIYLHAANGTLLTLISSSNETNSTSSQFYQRVNIRSFSYNELEEATNGFEEQLGTGAFSTVYKAVLNDENGKIVAVKKLHKTVTEGEQGFLAEVNSISRQRRTYIEASECTCTR